MLILSVCAMGGAAAGLAGAIEVAAVQGSASASLASGYGYTGILVAFLARQNPLAIIPVAVLLGGIDASDGLLQRHLDLPDATVKVLQGIVFVCVLAAETLSRAPPSAGTEASWVTRRPSASIPRCEAGQGVRAHHGGRGCTHVQSRVSL